MTNVNGAALGDYREALTQALGLEEGAGDADVLASLRRLTDQAHGEVRGEAARAELEVLGTVAGLRSLDEALAGAMRAYVSAAAFREAVFFARCLVRRPAHTLRALQFRRYLEAAVVSADLPDLATDREVTLSRTTFEEFWKAHDLGADAMLDWLQIWRRDFIFVYHDRHARHHAQVEDALKAVDALLPVAEAVARLDGIDGLGAPLGKDAVAGVLELTGLHACNLGADLLASALESRPACPRCGYLLGQQGPEAELARLQAAIEKALAGQQKRLAQHIVAKLLLQRVANGSERLERFIQVVQASDLAGLARVLDDGLIDFLRTIVEGAPETEPSVLQRLASAYPEVSPANLDAAVGELRRLLEDGVASGGIVRLREPEREQAAPSGQAGA